MGAATCFHLAKRGHRVLGIDRFSVPHNRGSHHGSTRMIRQAYFEDPAYVPLLRRAYQLWHDLESESGEKTPPPHRRTLHRLPPVGTIVPGSLAAAQTPRPPPRITRCHFPLRTLPVVPPAGKCSGFLRARRRLPPPRTRRRHPHPPRPQTRCQHPRKPTRPLTHHIPVRHHRHHSVRHPPRRPPRRHRRRLGLPIARHRRHPPNNHPPAPRLV